MNKPLAGLLLLVIGTLQPSGGLFRVWWPSVHSRSASDMDIVLLPLGVRELRTSGRGSVPSPSGDLSVGSEEGRPDEVCT